MLTMGLAARFSPINPPATSRRAVSRKLVKKYAEPEAGLAGHKVTILDPSNGRIGAEKVTDNLGYAMFDVQAAMR
jgi:hypothetical protein